MEKKRPPVRDVALLCGPTSEGDGVHILRARADRVELGVVRPLREGKPITGEVVTLKPRPDAPRLCDVEVGYAPAARTEAPAPSDPGASGAHDKPAQVASVRYRRNWGRTFGAKSRAN